MAKNSTLRPSSGALDIVETHQFDRDGGIPNSLMPLVVYRRTAAPGGDAPRRFENLFAAHQRSTAWRDGIFDLHHFHNHAHEVDGLARGHARARCGGPDGKSIELGPGDVAILPAGTGDCREEASADLLVRRPGEFLHSLSARWPIPVAALIQALLPAQSRYRLPAQIPRNGVLERPQSCLSLRAGRTKPGKSAAPAMATVRRAK